MALFKINKGSSKNLDTQQIHEGYAYLTTDDDAFYVDKTAADRVRLNPQSDWDATEGLAYIKNKPAAMDAEVQDADSEAGGTLFFNPTGKIPKDLEMVKVANGGTGATDAASARANLGVNLENLGVKATDKELNFVKGVTAPIQTQIDNIKKGTLTATYDAKTETLAF